MASTPDDFWQEYQTVKKSGLVQNAVSHVKRLSIRLETDTPERLESKKSAILWFMATGGKNGFRKTVATPEEKLILENALIFATILHMIRRNDPLSIIHVRRNAGISDQDQRTKTHLVAAQRVIVATRIMLESAMPLARFKLMVQEVFNKEYMVSVVYLLKYKSMSQWQQEVQKFANFLTRDLDRRIKNALFENLQLSVDHSIGFKEPVTETTASAFRQQLVESCTPDGDLFQESSALERKTPSNHPTSHRAMRIVTDNGLVIESGTNGSMKLVPQRAVQLGNMHLGAGSTMQIGKSFSAGPIQLNNEQTEEEFLAAINAFSIIVEKTYTM